MPSFNPSRHMAHLGGLVQALHRWVQPGWVGPHAVACQGLQGWGSVGRRQIIRHAKAWGMQPTLGQVAGATDPKRVDGWVARFIAGMGVEQHLHFVLQAAQVLSRW
jgi:hypothetical protein